MQVKFNLTGAERKTLVQNIALILLKTQKYQGAPTFAYTVGDYTIDKSGTLDCPEDAAENEHLLLELEMRGFIGERDLPAEQPAEEAIQENDTPNESDTPCEDAPQGDAFILSYPRSDISDAALENLRLLVASKSALIKKALGVEDLPIEVTADTVSFPWFAGFPQPEEISAYAYFTGKLIGMAKTQKRITAKEKETENEKYAFRCFLLRLGFIGDEYKAARKLLLRNLSGNGSFKSGEKKADNA